MSNFLRKNVFLLFCYAWFNIAYAEDRINKTYDLGEPATQEEIISWHTDVRPDGHGLPNGQGSVQQGKNIYKIKCAACHGLTGEGVGKFPALKGGNGSLNTKNPIKTVGSYWPYATTLWDYINRSMPFGNARTLTQDEVFSLTAYILMLNGVLDENAYLDRATLIKIEMPNLNGFYSDDESSELGTNLMPCMSNCKVSTKVLSAASSK